MRGRIRAALSALLCLALCLGTAGAAEGRDLTEQEALAGKLQSLGLFLGVGERADGSADFALDRPLTREEAVTMLVRALGKEDEAAAMEKTHPFTDVPAWADSYVSYAWENGLTKGTSDTAFGAGETATGAMYVTFMLRALDYVDGEDFTWDDPWVLARACGILPERVDRENFLRADAVEVTAAALSAQLKGGAGTLSGRLIVEGAIDPTEYGQAFPMDQGEKTYEEAMAELTEGVMPFVIEERWESDYGTVLLGQYIGTPHGAGPALRMVTKAAYAGGQGRVLALPLPAQDASSDARPDRLSLSEDGRTFTYSVHFDSANVLLQGTPEEYVFHQMGTYVYTTDLCTGDTRHKIVTAGMEGLPGTPAEQQAYEDAIRAILEGDYNRRELKRWEGETCTVLLTQNTGVFHAGLTIRLDLMGKPGSPLGAGERMPLPLPLAAPEEYAQPDELTFSADGQSLTYSCAVQINVPGMDSVTVIQEKGVYSYTVDLSTGEVTEVFSPLGETAGG